MMDFMKSCRFGRDYESTIWSRLRVGLGKVLPGERDGALLWYRDITRLLDMEEMVARLCLLPAPNIQACATSCTRLAGCG